MVTAELAVAIPVVVLVLAFCAAGIGAGIDQIRCVDAARTAARSAARGDPVGESRMLGVRAAPHGAHIEVDRGGSEVRVVVTVRAGGMGGFVPGWHLRAVATGPVEVGGAVEVGGP
ncbi:TadE family type IV pilus minor pilin [Intrasporangium sp.]|uniref:TadE family type IV pilus minor pilin n=1 Tax=Intrasporangium sp. TaxID=1925024 RepID=UPI00264A1342|nr:TadE family type IV pilus minor pilin [Intrasporangium sp.]